MVLDHLWKHKSWVVSAESWSIFLELFGYYIFWASMLSLKMIFSSNFMYTFSLSIYSFIILILTESICLIPSVYLPMDLLDAESKMSAK